MFVTCFPLYTLRVKFVLLMSFIRLSLSHFSYRYLTLLVSQFVTHHVFHQFVNIVLFSILHSLCMLLRSGIFDRSDLGGELTDLQLTQCASLASCVPAIFIHTQFHDLVHESCLTCVFECFQKPKYNKYNKLYT